MRPTALLLSASALCFGCTTSSEEPTVPDAGTAPPGAMGPHSSDASSASADANTSGPDAAMLLDAGPAAQTNAHDATTPSGPDGATASPDGGSGTRQLVVAPGAEITISDLACSGMPEPLGSSTGVSLRPVVLDPAGYAFTNAGYTRDLLDSELSNTQRCELATKTVVSWADRVLAPSSNASPTIVGANAGGGAVYGYNFGVDLKMAVVKTVAGEVAWYDNYDGFLQYEAYFDRPRSLGGSSSAMAHGGAAESALYAVAKANQLPGEAPNLAGLPVLVKYAPDGRRLWMRRMDASFASSKIAADPQDQLYAVVEETNLAMSQDPTLNHVRVRKYDPSGAELWTRDVPFLPSISFHQDGYTTIAASASGIFVLTMGSSSNAPDLQGLTVPSPDRRPVQTSLHLFQLSPSGDLVFNQELDYQHLTIIDPNEQVEWRGRHNYLKKWTLAPLHDGGVCLGGQYLNWYVNGSVPKDAHTNALVSCFAAGGVARWTHQYRAAYAPAGSTKPEQGTYLSNFVEASDGSFIVAADVAGGAGTVVFRLSAEGQPLAN